MVEADGERKHQLRALPAVLAPVDDRLEVQVSVVEIITNF